MPKTFVSFLFFVGICALSAPATGAQSVPPSSPGDQSADSFDYSPDFLAPEKTVDLLAARADDWQEPSRKSEEIYVLAIRRWLDTLPPPQREITTKILREAHPALKNLRAAIREKKAELASLSFSSDTRPETLPRLGQELQTLRASLRAELEKLNRRLKSEAGARMGPLGGDGFWLPPPAAGKS